MTEPPAAPNAKPARTRAPVYLVFMLSGKGGQDPPEAEQANLWVQLTKSPIAAASRQQAVEKILAAKGKPDEKGPFLVIPAKEFWQKSKRTETQKREVWS